MNLSITTSGDEDNLEGNADIKPIIKGGKVFTTLTDSFSHTSLIGKPRHFKLGDNFYQFCERFIEYVNINGITWHLDLIFLSLLDDRTHASLKNVTLADEDKHCPEKLCKAYQAAFTPNVGNGAMLVELYTLKQDRCESVDDFSYRIGNIAQKMSMPKRELNVHKLEAFIKGLQDSAIKLEIARDKKTLSYDKAVIAAKCLEKFFSENGINNGYTSNIEKVQPIGRTDHKSGNKKHDKDHYRSYSRDINFRNKNESRRIRLDAHMRDGCRKLTYPDVDTRGPVRGTLSHCTICHRKGHSTVNCYYNHEQRTFSCKICGRKNHNEKSCFYRNKNKMSSSYHSDCKKEHLNLLAGSIMNKNIAIQGHKRLQIANH